MDEKGKKKEADGRTAPIAIVFKNGNENEPETITKLQNNTPFNIVWHPTDAQNGYYEVVESKGWVNVCDDNLLSKLKDSVDLQEFDGKIKEFMKENAIEFYIVICRASNPSSSGYDLFAKEQDMEKLREFIKSMVETVPELGSKCPKCKQGKLLLIVYGHPTKVAEEAAKTGDILLGGCCVTDNDPTFGCNKCGANFGGKKEALKYRKLKKLFGF